jgi:serine protease SohB
MPKIVLIIIAILTLCLLWSFWRKKRKNSQTDRAEKHSSGLKVYHKNTKIRLRTPLEAQDSKSKIAVIDFKGDIKASDRYALSRLFDEILLNQKLLEELVLKVESPGGGVAEYGFLYAELERLRERAVELKITVCVDTVAASGGYLMSLPAHQILAAPFSMVGSIGVVSFVPNIRKLLESWKIQPRTFTAGSYKRTVSLTDDATTEEQEHYRQQLALIHEQFKHALKKYRPQVNLDDVATGEAWLASTTLDKNLGLIDRLCLSSDYLMELNKNRSLVYFKQEPAKKGWRAFLGRLSNKAQDLLSQNV